MVNLEGPFRWLTRPASGSAHVMGPLVQIPWTVVASLKGSKTPKKDSLSCAIGVDEVWRWTKKGLVILTRG